MILNTNKQKPSAERTLGRDVGLALFLLQVRDLLDVYGILINPPTMQYKSQRLGNQKPLE